MDNLANVVVRDVRDRDGVKRGRIVEHHGGTEAGIVAAARKASERMWGEYSDASNVESRICATDVSGKIRWAISPNFLHIAEVGTDEATYIWGGPAPTKPLDPIKAELLRSFVSHGTLDNEPLGEHGDKMKSGMTACNQLRQSAGS